MSQNLSELNPQHPVTLGLRNHWHKIAAMIMLKLGHTEIELTPKDIAQADRPEGVNIVCHDTAGVLKISIVDNQTAHFLAHS